MKMKLHNAIMDKGKCKLLLLYLLKQLDKVCVAGGIRYYAYAGTILGAVRHYGMIPWDDDIDVVISRKDYNRFVEICEERLKKPVVVRTRENDPFFCAEYIKLCFQDDEHGYSDLSIDVFILDETNPANKLLRWLQNLLVLNLYSIKYYKVSREDGHTRYIPHNPIKHLYLALWSILPYRFIDWLLWKTMQWHGTNPSAYTIWGSHYNYNKVTFAKELWSGLHTLKFENTTIPVPTHFLDILQQMYGPSFMSLPSPDKRVDHGVRDIHCQALDLDMIFQEVNQGEL